jgi:hypothetical protein
MFFFIDGIPAGRMLSRRYENSIWKSADAAKRIAACACAKGIRIFPAGKSDLGRDHVGCFISGIEPEADPALFRGETISEVFFCGAGQDFAIGFLSASDHFFFHLIHLLPAFIVSIGKSDAKVERLIKYMDQSISQLKSMHCCYYGEHEFALAY